MGTTHFSGVTNIPSSHPLGRLGTMHPARWMIDGDDFFKDETGIATSYTETLVGTGTSVLTAGDGGLLLITNSAAGSDSVALQRPTANMLLDTQKDAFFETRLKINDVTQSLLVAGLQSDDTTPFAVTDGIYFDKPDGSAVVSLAMFKASAGSVTLATVATLVNDTFVKLQWYYDASAARLYFGTDDVVRGYTDALTNFPNTVNLLGSFALQNGEAVAKNMTVDYWFGGRQRF